MTANQAKLERMAVSEPFRRKGIGRRLIYYLNEELIKRGVSLDLRNSDWLGRKYDYPRFFLSQSIFKAYLCNVLERLHLKNRTQVVAKGAAQGLFE